MILPVRLLIGLVALIVSVPMVVYAMVPALIGNNDQVNWIMDNCPLAKWFDYLDQR